ncbi:MAG TPA: nucleotidyl transferase AbiEii/AbiGii toxin family protein [Bacilli bacterium]|nr:nucleotidyl transferase AbiEii/AbiGii toxin family protein [Bacilli bacterium]
MFYFERILERISISKYKGQIILKGGVLLSSIIGIDERTTRDMDATLKGIFVSREKVIEIFSEILNIKLDDCVKFKIINIKNIRLDEDYNGFRLNILATLDNNKTNITIDLTTGDVITPREIKYSYNLMFEGKKISIMAYTIETVLAEKFQTIISRGILNTRMKDFADIYSLINGKDKINTDNLILAIKNTFAKRKTKIDINEFKVIVSELKESHEMNKRWIKFQNNVNYVTNIEYLNTIKSINKIIEILELI